jgi:coenzyme F420-dependent glucose-6-phosphate dehydrogenase
VGEAFRRGGGAGKPMYLKVGLSYARTMEEARLGAHQQWRAVAFPNELLTELRTPREFDQAGKHVRPEDMDSVLRISNSPQQHAEWIAEDLAMGFGEVILHNINTNQEEFLEMFGKEVLPQFSPTHSLEKVS